MEALALENNLIKRHQPPYNVRLRDDKNHPYLKLTLKRGVPAALRGAPAGRGRQRLRRALHPGEPRAQHRARWCASCSGSASCKETLNGQRPRPCLQYQIKRCIAPCVAEICSLERYRRACEDARLFLEGRTEEVTRRLREQMAAAAGAERYEEAASLRDQVQALVRLEAPQKITTTEIEERDLFAAHVEGERAAVQVFCVRDGKVVAREGFLLDRLTEPERGAGRDAAAVLRRRPLRAARGRRAGRRSRTASCSRPGSRARRGAAVRIHLPQRGEKLRLSSSWRATPAWPSTSSGSTRASSRRRSCARCATCSTSSSSRSASSASTSPTSRARTSSPRWSCSRSGLPKKADYRKFRVKSVSGAPDDFASMREVVGRRYKRLLEEGKELPDLVLIDGGKGQLGAAVEALEELGLGEQPVVSLAKREELIFVRGRERADRAAAQLAGAAARPARARRGAPLRGRLPPPGALAPHDRVRARRRSPGIGPAKRRKLLSAFGSVRGVRGASEAELAGVVGKSTAARLRAHFDR